MMSVLAITHYDVCIARKIRRFGHPRYTNIWMNNGDLSKPVQAN